MTTRTRFAILLITAPILAFAVVGGLMGKTLSRQETYPHLRVFDDVFNLTTGNYVEEVDVDRLMHGAMHGLAESLDADSAYLTPEQAKLAQAGRGPGAGGRGARSHAAGTTCGSWPRATARPPRRPASGPATSCG